MQTADPDVPLELRGLGPLRLSGLRTLSRLVLGYQRLRQGRRCRFGARVVANHRLAPIVGGPTAGSNGGINIYVLPGGYRVSYTGQLTVRQDGTRFHGVGVLPTVPVRRTVKAVAEGRDEVLEKALELVQS